MGGWGSEEEVREEVSEVRCHCKEQRTDFVPWVPCSYQLSVIIGTQVISLGIKRMKNMKNSNLRLLLESLPIVKILSKPKNPGVFP